MPYKIAFDSSHKERGSIEKNYSQLKELLESNNFQCDNFAEPGINQTNITSYDILVFACPDFAKISRQEIAEIEKWVSRDGGGLLILSHAGGDKGRSSNLSELSERFGIAFENDQVLDEKKNIMDIENLPLITEFIPPHPITQNVNEICFRAGCSLSVVGNAFSICSSNETSEPFSCPLICISQPENGRVCAVGSYEMFRNDIGGGLTYGDHSKLILNIFNWLISDKRIFSEHEAVVESAEEGEITDVAEVEEASLETTEEEKITIPKLTLSEITSKNDIINLLNSFSIQLDTMKLTVENIVSALSESSSESNSDLSNDNDIVKEIFGPSKLSELPPKPKSIKNSGEPVQIKAPKMEEVIDTKSTKIGKKGVKPSKIGDEFEQIQEEIERLEKKLTSIYNLLSFLDKKYNSGKITEKEYKKQKSKLQKDIENTRKRLKERNKSLEEGS